MIFNIQNEREDMGIVELIRIQKDMSNFHKLSKTTQFGNSNDLCVSWPKDMVGQIQKSKRDTTQKSLH